MIISLGRRYIFVHAPKTGGTAVSLALEDRAMKDDILIGDTPKAKRRKNRLKDLKPAGRMWKHSTLADIEGVVDRAAFDDVMIVTIVRNPWDRMVSYYHWLREQGFDNPAVTLAKASSFSDFIAHKHTQASFRVAPYGHYVTDGAGVERDTHFIRLEHLDVDLAPFNDHLGFEIGPIGRANASQRDPDYRGYYSDADRDVIADLCAADIARFGYQFG
jgi:hypothetical protein